MQHLLFRKNCYKCAVNCCLVWSDVMILLGLGVLTLSISLMPYPTPPPLCSPLLLALDIQLAHLVVKLCLFCCVFFFSFSPNLITLLLILFFSLFSLSAVHVSSFICLLIIEMQGGCGGTALSHAKNLLHLEGLCKSCTSSGEIQTSARFISWL